MNALRELLAWIQHESVTVAGYPLPWIEIVGNLFGFASAILGMRRKVWAWPIGIIGNLLLFIDLRLGDLRRRRRARRCSARPAARSSSS